MFRERKCLSSVMKTYEGNLHLHRKWDHLQKVNITKNH